MLSDAEYRMYMDQIGELAAILTRIPVDELLHIVDQSDALGPILEPTAYRDGGARRLEEQRRVLNAAKTLRDIALTLEVAQAVGEADQ